MTCWRPHSQNSNPSLLILIFDPLHYWAKYGYIFCLVVDFHLSYYWLQGNSLNQSSKESLSYLEPIVFLMQSGTWGEETHRHPFEISLSINDVAIDQAPILSLYVLGSGEVALNKAL